MKKVILIIVIFCIVIAINYAQVQLVHDALVFGQQVTQTINLIKQIYNDIKQMQYIYQQLQLQVNNVKQFNPQRFQDYIRFINEQSNFVNTMEYRIRNVSVEIDGEVYGINEWLPVLDGYNKQMEKIRKTAKDDETARELLAKTGLSQESMDLGLRIAKKLKRMSEEAKVINKDIKDNEDNLNNQLNQEINTANSQSDSTTAQLQTLQHLFRIMIDRNRNLERILASMNESQTDFMAAQLAKEKLAEADPTIVTPALSDDFYDTYFGNSNDYDMEDELE